MVVAQAYALYNHKKNIAMEEFEKSMDGIFSTSVCPGTIDKSPQAYKPMEEKKYYVLLSR